MKLARTGADPTFDHQSWPEGFTLSRLLGRAKPYQSIYILRRHADDTFHWQAPGRGDPVGPFDLESEAIEDADAAHFNILPPSGGSGDKS